MDETNSEEKNKIFGALEISPVFQLVTVASISIGLISSLDSLSFPPQLYLFGLIVAGLSIVFSVRTILRRRMAKALPEASEQFNPFPSTASWKPWPRKKITSELASVVGACPNRHVLVTAPSGVGKSVMVNALLPEALSEYHTILIDDYDDIVSRLLNKVGEIADETHSLRINEVRAKYKGSKQNAGDLKLQVKEAVKLAIGERPVMFVFDQVERYFIRSEQMSNDDFGLFKSEGDVVKCVLDAMIEMANVRSVFAIRSEHVFGSLVNLFNSELNGSRVQDRVRFYFLWGVNSQDDSNECFRISNYLTEEVGGTTMADKVVALSNIDNQQRANTFVLNLAGYVFENLRRKPKFGRLLSSGRITEAELIDVFLEATYEGYLATGKVSERAHFDSVLLALATENRSSGLACDRERIAALAHYPTEEVEGTVNYLVNCGLAQVDSAEDGGDVYRLAHDRVADRILKSELLDVHPREADAVRHLSENKIPTSDLIAPEHFPKALELQPKNMFDLSYFPVVLFSVYGLIRLIWPESTYELLQPVTSWFGDNLGMPAPAYYVNPIFYVPHFIAHIAWLSFGDRVNRSYLRHVHSGFFRGFADLGPLIGVVSAIAVSFTPQLFVLPIFLGGLVLGSCLFIASHRAEFGGEMKTITRLWGLRTVANVCVVMVFGLATANFFAGDTSNYFIPFRDQLSQETQLFIGILAVAGALMWFWQHIGNEQNNARIWSANLAYYDKGRNH